jgi:hypothetical protein
MHNCIDVWRGDAGEVPKLPALPGWAATIPRQRFVDVGGYGGYP